MAARSPKNPPVILYWHRADLRLSDNPALAHAAANGRVQPVFVYDDTIHDWSYGGASLWWLHHSLTALQASYKKHGVTLLLRKGSPQDIVPQLAKDLQAAEVVWNRRYEPQAIERDTALKEVLVAAGHDVHSFNAHLLIEPWHIHTKGGTPFKVFTPFWRTLDANAPQIEAALDAPETIRPVAHKIKSDDLKDWQLLPEHPDWATGFHWQTGEAAAQKRLHEFLDDGAGHYKDERNFPGKDGTARMSPHLAFGEIGPRQIWHAAHTAQKHHKVGTAYHTHSEAFLRQIAWRDFAYHLLYHYPHTVTKPLTPSFKKFPFRRNAKELRAWQKGMTGYPLVDAGMRQVWQTGWMHNRVRLVVSSFLVKHLAIDWRRGSEYFWDTLVDADLANNTMGWQWVMGSGADASPYFRIFNPVIQSRKFDAAGDYIRTFVPELAALPDKHIHAPWEAPASVLKEAGIVLGKDYPKPIVEHAFARERALGLLKRMRAATKDERSDDQ